MTTADKDGQLVQRGPDRRQEERRKSPRLSFDEDRRQGQRRTKEDRRQG